MTVRRRRWLLALGSFGILLFLVSVVAILTLQSPWFSIKVHDRIVAEVEKASGGRTEFGTFEFDWKRLQARVDGFVLHGTESASEAPLLTVKHVAVGLGLRAFLRTGVHVRTIVVDEPKFHLIATADGKTNLPLPKVKQGDKDFIDTLLELAANEITVRNGTFQLNERRVPVDLVAQNVDVHLLFNTNRARPIYFGDVASKQLRMDLLNFGTMTFALDSSVAIEHGVIQVTRAKLSTKASKIDVSGYTYHLLDPSSDFGVTATLALSEFAGPLHLPLEKKGVAQFVGKVSLALKDKFRYSLEGRVKGRGLAIREGPVEVSDAALDTLVAVNPQGVKFRRTFVTALGGTFAGAGALADFRKLSLEGEFKDFSTAKVLLAARQKPFPYSAIARGPLRFTAELGSNGLSNGVLKTEVTLASGCKAEQPCPMPLEGLVNMTWTQATGTLALGQSHVATPFSSLEVSGTLGQRLDVIAKTTRLADIQPLLSEPLPVQLGSAGFQGSVTGPLENPQIDGHATLTTVVYEGRTVDSVTADFSLRRDGLDAPAFSATQGVVKLDGSGGLRLQNWKASSQSPLTAKVTLSGATIQQLLKELKQTDVPVTGAVTVVGNLRGSAGELSGEAQVTAENVVAWDEDIERMKALVKLTPDRVELADGTALFHKAEIPFGGSFTHKPDEWTSGTVAFNVKTQSLDVTQLVNLRKRYPLFKGLVTSTLAGTGAVANKAFRLTALNGDAGVRNLTYEDRPVGSVELHTVTKGQDLNVTATGLVRGARIRLNGNWKLDGGKYPGGGEVSLSQVTLQTLRDLMLAGERTPLPFQSAVEASATFTVSLGNPRDFLADLKIQRLFLAPGATQRLGAGAKEQDLILENARPIVVHVTPNNAVIEPALFRATNTNIEVAGKVGFEARQGWDLSLKGALNLGQLQMFRQDLLASGTATVDATVRGTLTDPQVNGQLTLSKASLYFGDLPAGLDNVNGVVSFDRNRATIQTMTADSGGGKMSLTGFVGFGGPALVYRMQGNATGVRVRYPEGASTTVNANISLTGTSQESLLAGTVTIVRAAFTPRSDLGSLMANLTKPNAPSIPQDNDYIRGMQLDVRIESAPSLEFQTSLTRGLQAEVDLRLRGTAVRPTLLGDVGFSEGEISLFGNKYTLNRGDIRFFNPTRIEPVFDLEAETRARGIDVNVSFSGTPSKMNVSYRSDPPLQPSDIIALLAIGRDPNVSAGIASSQLTQQSLTAGLGNVVGEAVASSVTNRLQKFFGVTKIKIDPQLTGLDNIPQARLTLEQQVSKNITLTYITNISRTQETIVRIQWDLSREWSAIAVREENGLFGVDFQYKKRFK